MGREEEVINNSNPTGIVIRVDWKLSAYVFRLQLHLTLCMFSWDCYVCVILKYCGPLLLYRFIKFIKFRHFINCILIPSSQNTVSTFLKILVDEVKKNFIFSVPYTVIETHTNVHIHICICVSVWYTAAENLKIMKGTIFLKVWNVSSS